VVEIRGNSVRLGIEAPRNIPVMRTEIITQRVNAALDDGTLNPLEKQLDQENPCGTYSI
jgi:carbon storage regulator CsrA